LALLLGTPGVVLVPVAAMGAAHAHGPSNVHVHQRVSYWSDALPPHQSVSVTLQLGSYVGSNNGATYIHKQFSTDDSGFVSATFRWPKHWYTCVGHDCHQHNWP